MSKIADSLKSMCDSVDKMKSACDAGYKIPGGGNPNQAVREQQERERRLREGGPTSKRPEVKIDPEKLKRAQEQAEATKRLMGF